MRAVVSNEERTSAVLRITLRSADILQFLELNRSLVDRFELLDLAKYSVDVVKAIARLGRASGGQLFASLTDHEPDSNGARRIWTVWTTNDAESIVR